MSFQSVVGVLFGLVLVRGGIRVIISPDQQASTLAKLNRVFGITYPKRIRNAPAERYRPVARLSGVVISIVGVWVAVYMVIHP